MSPVFARHLRLGTALVALVGVDIMAFAPARAQTPQDSASAQPVLPRPETKPGSPVVEDLVGPRPQPALEVRKRPAHVASRAAAVHRRNRVAHRARPLDLDRPALAGVELLAPLPRPGETSHIEVPLPAYPLDSIAAAYLTPAPPIVCHPVPRDPDLPDPRLYRERTVACEADNP